MPVWIPILGLVLFGVLGWKGMAFFRLASPGRNQPAVPIAGPGSQVASEEPDTEPLATVSNDLGRPRSAALIDLETIDTDKRPEGCNAVLLVAGRMSPDRPFKRFCFVNADKINVVIGRSGADINIENAAISRRHVRIESDGENLTIADLGSRNGTSVSDIPCLPGEIFYIEPEDEIFLGDVQLSVYVNRQEAEWA
jgi:hypothetical protein